MGRARFFRNDWWFCCPNETSSCVRQWVEAYLKNQYLNVSEVAYSTSLGSPSLSFNTRSEPLGNDKAGECCLLFILPSPYRTYAVRNVCQVPWSYITLPVPQNYLKMHWGISYLGKDSIQPALWIQLVERTWFFHLFWVKRFENVFPFLLCQYDTVGKYWTAEVSEWMEKSAQDCFIMIVCLISTLKKWKIKSSVILWKSGQ